MIYATVSIARRQSKQQKEIHEQKLLADREDRIINIYSIFADCGRSFISMLPMVNFRLGLLPNETDMKRMVEQQTRLCKALDEARLIFDDGSPILKQLDVVSEKFQQLSRKELEMLANIKEQKLEDIDPVLEKFQDEVRAFRKTELSYENFDDYFKPYINRIPIPKNNKCSPKKILN